MTTSWSTSSLVALVATMTMTTTVTAQMNNSMISLPDQLTYYIPASNITSSPQYQWTNGTTTSNDSVNALLSAATQSTFISYTAEFASIIGDDPAITTIACPEVNSTCAFEAGVWIPDRDEVWFSPFPGEYGDFVEGLTSFNIANGTAAKVQTSEPVYANGGYLFDGKAWFASSIANGGTPSTIFSIDPSSGAVEPLLNSYFGIPFPTADEPVWVTRDGDDDDGGNGGGQSRYLFFSGVSFASFVSGYPVGNLTNAVWRFDPQTGLVQPVIGRTAINVPNGVRVSPDQKTLYVTNTESSSVSGYGAGNGESVGIPAIYRYDLDDDAYPINGRLWALARTGIPDGMHVDMNGRVWTAEGGGIIVRNAKGKVLGSINMVALQHPGFNAVTNFGLAGDKLVIGAYDQVVVIQLNQTVVTQSK